MLADAMRKTVALVDGDPQNLAAGREILKDTYEVFPITSGHILFNLLENVIPDIILLDMQMPVMGGIEVIKKLKQNPQWAQVPLVLHSAAADISSCLKGLDLGASDYVEKPFWAPLLLKRMKTHLELQAYKKQLWQFEENLEGLVHAKTMQVSNLLNAVLSTIADLVEFRDNMTGGHVVRTQKYLEILIRQMAKAGIYNDEVHAWDLDYLLPSAQLHDVGKIAISDAILNKPGPLTSAEFEVMKGHVAVGMNVILKIKENVDENPFLRYSHLIASSHHEKWDGSGYPAGLKGVDIPLEGRLMAIADVYDALISKRSYKKPLSTDEARHIIEDGRGTHFDPALIEIFSKVADEFAEVVSSGLN